MILRSFQKEILDKLLASSSNDLVQLDTGAGKTPIEAAFSEQADYSLLVAHRNILIIQMSEKLAAFGLEHDTISTEYTRRRCMESHRRHGRNYIKRGHNHRLVASIDSLISHHRRGGLTIDATLPWEIIIDEAHHVIPDNKWGQLSEIFPNARITGYTATPARTDGGSLHVDNGGLFHRLVQSEDLRDESVRKLISRGYLSDFTVFAPPADDAWRVGWQGDQLAIARDPVESYQQFADGLRTVLMCPSIKNAEEMAGLFRDAGYAAACISSEMPATAVSRVLDAFVAGQIQLLCNVDMVGEGFDVPGIEALMMLRKTASFIAYRQWIGRALRPAENKRAVIIDLVGNVAEHDLPDVHVSWDIKQPPAGITKIKNAPCRECHAYYPVYARECPFCGKKNPLLKGSSIGSHHVTLQNIDFTLVEQVRREIKKEKEENRLSREIIWPKESGTDTISRAVYRLKRKFVDCLQGADMPVREINRFLHDSNTRSTQWWIKRFALADLKAESSAKFLKVYEKWLKSN